MDRVNIGYVSKSKVYVITFLLNFSDINATLRYYRDQSDHIDIPAVRVFCATRLIATANQILL